MTVYQNKLFLAQLFRFLLVGALNTIFDLLLLNIMTFISGVKYGLGYSFQKTISAGAAIVFSYILNKHWAFKFDTSINRYFEFGKFMVISLFSMTVQVVVATFVVSYIRPYFKIYGPFMANAQIWVNIGAISGSIFSAISNFIGYKYIVFVRNAEIVPTSK